MSFENFENKKITEKDPQREKPKFFYHGSLSADLEEISPKFRSVFATPDKAFASMFLGSRPDDSWSAKGKLGEVYYILIADEDKYRANDKGGVIYKVSSEKFIRPEKGMRTEWIANDPIAPISKEECPSAFNAMIENGVQVYFVDQKTLNDFKKMIKDGPLKTFEFLKNLQSENQKLGKGIKSFDSENKEKK